MTRAPQVLAHTKGALHPGVEQRDQRGAAFLDAESQSSQRQHAFTGMIGARGGASRVEPLLDGATPARCPPRTLCNDGAARLRAVVVTQPDAGPSGSDRLADTPVALAAQPGDLRLHEVTGLKPSPPMAAVAGRAPG